MFADTITLTIAGSPVVLTRIDQSDPFSSIYYKRTSLIAYQMRIRHTKSAKAGKLEVERHNVEVTATYFATDTVPQFDQKAYFVMEHPSSQPSIDFMAALATWATASTNANLTKLEAWES